MKFLILVAATTCIFSVVQALFGPDCGCNVPCSPGEGKKLDCNHCCVEGCGHWPTVKDHLEVTGGGCGGTGGRGGSPDICFCDAKPK